MPLGISYMGTKRALATTVAGQVSLSRPGPFLDLFAGMCSVGSAVGTERPVWNNDLQIFASSVANAFFCSAETPPAALDLFQPLRANYLANLEALKQTEEEIVLAEENALRLRSIAAVLDISQQLTERASSPEVAELRATRRGRRDLPASLFTWNFAGSYLGLRQCMEVDSIRFSIDREHNRGAITAGAHRWLCLALARAVSRCSTSTGHFAQPLSPKANNIERYVRQRRRSVWAEWFEGIDDLLPLGNSRWRANNRAYCGDAQTLVGNWEGVAPAVVYADPPYTNDQYSRYYHLYETLIMYDYPAATGVGRYREDRPVSSFSLKAGVQGAIEKLLSGVAAMGSDIVMSYPANGLLANSRDVIPDMMRMHFRDVAVPIEIKHSHSTMGGSKGPATSDVTEVLYRAAA